MKKTLLIGILVLIAGGALAMNDYIKPHTYRYKITINIETPDGIKSGSSVRELAVTRQPRITPETTSATRMKGESVVIDLGGKEKLFGLISHNSYNELLHAFDYMGGAFSEGELSFYDNIEMGEKREVTNKRYWSNMVRFRDISDPLSVESVHKENLSVTYGDGYSIQNVTVEITDEPITNKKLDSALLFDLDNLLMNWKEMSLKTKKKISELQYLKVGS